MNINIDGKNFEIKTLADFKRAGEEIKRVNDFKVEIAKNKYERTKNISRAEQVLRKELNDLNKEYQAKLDELWKAKREMDLQNSKEEKDNADYSKYLTAEEMEYLKKVDFPNKHDARAQKIFEKYVRAKNKEEGIHNEEKGNAIEYTTITQKEWDDLKRHGYTDVIGGIKYALIGHPTKGTILAPVKINEKGYYEQIIEQKNGFEEEYSKLMFKMKRMQGDPKTTWSQMEDLNKEFSELKKKYGKPHNYGMTNEKRNFGDEVLIEKKSFGEYWYSIYQKKDKMILRVYTPFGMYYIDDIRDLADGRNEAQRTIDIVKKAGRYV